MQTPDIRFQMPESIRENIARVQERIATACRRVGRSPQEVRLLAACKNVPPERIREAFEAGVRDFGENRVQEAGAKRPALADLTVAWHLIGHLQSNKAKAARDLFHWVQSLDSFHLAEKLHRSAPCSGDRLTVLLEVNLGGEPAKSGSRESEVLDLARKIGVTLAIDPRERNLADVQKKLGMTEGFDVGMEMSGNASAFRDMLANMSHGGRVAMLGIPPGEMSIDWNKVIFNMLTIQGIYGREMYETWYKMTVMLESGLDISKVITHRFHYTEFQSAFELMKSGNSGKIILDWSA